jgi:dihydroneopterin aldolase
MRIHIESLNFYTIIGILEFERFTPQRVVIDVEIDYDYKGEFINYAEVIEVITNDMMTNKYFLLETALNEIKNRLFETYNITFLKLKISKPDIIHNAVVSLSNEYKSDKKTRNNI